MDSLAVLWNNRTLIIPISIMFGVQLYKFLWTLWRSRQFNWLVLFSTGGMPSSHSALVTSLATATGIQYGFGGPIFAIAAVLALIVMYDARGVRQESGQHARVINHIVREMFSGHALSERELKELLGHTTIEVFVGAIVGVLYTLIWFAFLD